MRWRLGYLLPKWQKTNSGTFSLAFEPRATELIPEAHPLISSFQRRTT